MPEIYPEEVLFLSAEDYCASAKDLFKQVMNPEKAADSVPAANLKELTD